MFGFLTKIFGSKNERFVKKLQSVVNEINAVEPELTALSDKELRQRFDDCLNKVKSVRSLDDLLVDVFAIVREVSKRKLYMRHFDVQLIGGIVLHQGKIAEMKTGEGKTLAATLAVVLNALRGEGVHVVTVNDYLAKRDARWMGPIYHFLGLSVGVVQHEASFLYDPDYKNEDISLEFLRPISRRAAYMADITYGTNNEFGFDYLRDNMRYDLDDMVQKEFNFAIIDEVDSILIDEARTPLIISGPAEESTEMYKEIDKLIPRIPSDGYSIDEKAKTANLTWKGSREVEKFLGIKPSIKLTEKSLKRLREEDNLPEDIINKLENLQDIKFTKNEKDGKPSTDTASRFKDIEDEEITDKGDTLPLDIVKNIGSLKDEKVKDKDEEKLLKAEEKLFESLEQKLLKAAEKEIDDAEQTARYKAAILESAERESLYSEEHIETLHYVSQALKAHKMFKRDVDYLVKDNQVIIIDEFTGRLMPGRRWSEGLHQAIEAKEGVNPESENQTLATITFQNLFRMYKKLAGMTGTAETEAAEFAKIYNLDVIVIPTNKPMARIDYSDLIYKTQQAKFNSVVKEIEECFTSKQPILVGTVTIENSEKLHTILNKKKIPHSVLNAKFHEKEAEIIAQAGRSGSVTIATNMAGRGTDIILGGNPEGLAKSELKGVKDYTEEDYQKVLQNKKEICEADKQKVIELGGLHILGTERHEARRIDNQLRGRSGRQGDPGSSRFYLSLEDDLMRIFGSDRIANIMEKLGLPEDEKIEHKFISRAVENAQKKVESHNFDIRKHLLEYDDVMNQQRTEIYNFRRYILQSVTLKARIIEMAENIVEDLIDKAEEKEWDKWSIDDFLRSFNLYFAFKPTLNYSQDDFQDIDKIRTDLFKQIRNVFDHKEKELAKSRPGPAEVINRLRFLGSQWINYPLACQDILYAISSAEEIMEIAEKIVDHIIEQNLQSTKELNQDSLENLTYEIYNVFHLKLTLETDNDVSEIKERILSELTNSYKTKEEQLAQHLLRFYEKVAVFHDDSMFDKFAGDFLTENTVWKELLVSRRNILEDDNIKQLLLNRIDEVVVNILSQSELEDIAWNKLVIKKLQDSLHSVFDIKEIDLYFDEETDVIDFKENIVNKIIEQSNELQLAENLLHYYERLLFTEILLNYRFVSLMALDSQWKDHLLAMDQLKEGIGLRGYGQRDPIVEYKKEAFAIFSDLGDRIADKIVTDIYHIKVSKEDKRKQYRAFNQDDFQYNRSDNGGEEQKTFVRKGTKPRRNEPCPCGSGKKYKKCCMLKVK